MNNNPHLLLLIGQNIKNYREAKNLTQEELGFLVGLTRTSLINIECGRQSVPATNLFALCHALDVEIGQLFPERAKLKIKLGSLESYRKAEAKKKIAALKNKIKKLQAKQK